MDSVPCAYTAHKIRVSQTHILSVLEYGNPEGIPAVFLHGGPGSGCRVSALARVFDLERFRVVAPDQRGAGASTPKGCLEDNTTQHLISDLEAVREQIGINRWLVVGGSWGALLAIAYAQSHPGSVAGIAVRSFFFGDDASVRRAFIDVPELFYPELFRQFIGFLDADERAQPLPAYYRRLLDPDEAVYRPASCMWHDYERALSTISPGSVSLPVNTQDDHRPLPATPRIEAHYFSQGCFLAPGELLDGVERLKGIKGILVQGRCDMLCPPYAAHELSRHWPDAMLVMVDAAGHSQSEPGVESALSDGVCRIAAGFGSCEV